MSFLNRLLAKPYTGILRFIRNLKAARYTSKVRKQAASCGENLRVNRKSSVTHNTHLGNHVNFNGMEITGGGYCTGRKLLSFG